ncbi:unnamed protein product [Paramecium sonneborni]|uniref:Uncharacterized protein n=1 Tax=Paramecium sonneborni TaxID=65129 RepID=A0A8S1M1J3_9CILI|nr:unnamed protein product [Paramecium sonneborni]
MLQSLNCEIERTKMKKYNKIMNSLLHELLIGQHTSCNYKFQLFKNIIQNMNKQIQILKNLNITSCKAFIKQKNILQQQKKLKIIIVKPQFRQKHKTQFKKFIFFI